MLVQQACAKIPNKVAREVFVERLLANLRLKLGLKGQAQLSDAVSLFLNSFDPTALVGQLLNNSLLPEENHDDVIHSLASTFKTRFQVLILAGLPERERHRLMNKFCFDPSDPFYGQADSVLIPPRAANPEHPVLLVEFKNSRVSDLMGMPWRWQEQIEKSQEFLGCSDDQIKALGLKITQYNKFSTIGDRWNGACQELRKNANKLKSNFPDNPIVGFVIYRVGLHRVMFQSFNNL